MTLESLKPGHVEEASQMVVENLTAAHLGSGTLRVFATPAMVLFIEEVCRKMVEPFLAAGESTVGVSLKVRHLAPTPMGQTVRCRAEVVDVDAGVITFRADVWDPTEKIGEAEHKRAVIDVDRFLRRVEAKTGGGATEPARDEP
jgi:fluoroacetyl-CoA thioesterase